MRRSGKLSREVTIEQPHTLSVAWIVRDEMAFLPQSIESVNEIADELVFVLDTRSKDGTREFLSGLAEIDPRVKLYGRVWDKGALQKQFLREQCGMEWILFLDGDEVVSDNAYLIKRAIKAWEINVFSFLGHHYINHLGVEDSTNSQHLWEMRLIRNVAGVRFTGENHALLWGPAYVLGHHALINDVRIHHFGYVKNLVGFDRQETELVGI